MRHFGEELYGLGVVRAGALEQEGRQFYILAQPGGFTLSHLQVHPLHAQVSLNYLVFPYGSCDQV